MFLVDKSSENRSATNENNVGKRKRKESSIDRIVESQIKKKKWRPFNVRRLEELATPPAREMPVGRDPFKVPITALTYKISKRLLKIAFPKVPTEIMPPRVPGQVSPAALKAVGTYFSNFFPSPLSLSLFLSFPPPSSLPTCHSTRTKNFRRVSSRVFT